MVGFHHHFTPLAPAIANDELGKLETLGTINFDTKSGFKLIARLLGFDERVRVIAVTVPEAAASHEDHSKWHKQIVENALAAIRLTADSEAHPVFLGSGFLTFMYESDDAEPSFQIGITYAQNADYRLNIPNVLGVWQAIATKEISPIAALLAESQFLPIPPQYRVLSLVRAVELLFGEGDERNSALDQFQDEFAALDISISPFRSALPQLRTRCAHGRSRGRKNPEPFVGIGYNEPTLLPLIDLLQAVVVSGMRDRFGLEIVHNRALSALASPEA